MTGRLHRVDLIPILRPAALRQMEQQHHDGKTFLNLGDKQLAAVAAALLMLLAVLLLGSSFWILGRRLRGPA